MRGAWQDVKRILPVVTIVKLQINNKFTHVTNKYITFVNSQCRTRYRKYYEGRI